MSSLKMSSLPTSHQHHTFRFPLLTVLIALLFIACSTDEEQKDAADTTATDTTTATDATTTDTTTATDATTTATDATDTTEDVTEGCRSDQECDPNIESCVTQDDRMCGICMEPASCENDSTCGTGEVCSDRMLPCPCTSGSFCVTACSNEIPCVAGDSCVDGHCIPTPCGDCPAHFSCDVATNTCLRTTCQNDTECTAGFCVNGHCFADLGYCSPPVP